MTSGRLFLGSSSLKNYRADTVRAPGDVLLNRAIVFFYPKTPSDFKGIQADIARAPFGSKIDTWYRNRQNRHQNNYRPVPMNKNRAVTVLLFGDRTS